MGLTPGVSPGGRLDYQNSPAPQGPSLAYNAAKLLVPAGLSLGLFAYPVSQLVESGVRYVTTNPHALQIAERGGFLGTGLAVGFGLWAIWDFAEGQFMTYLEQRNARQRREFAEQRQADVLGEDFRNGIRIRRGYP